MALTSSGCTVLRSWEVVDRAGVFREKVSDVLIFFNTLGASFGDIPATAMGFAKIYSVSTQGAFIDPNTVGAYFQLETDGSGIFPIDLTQATDASRTTRANVSGVYYLRLTGVPK